MARKYLDDIGYTNYNKYENASDKRILDFSVENGVYGFNSSATWSLDITMLELIYERLMMFREKASEVVDLSFHKVQIKDDEKTIEQWVDTMIETSRELLLSVEHDDLGVYDSEEFDNKSTNFWNIWASVQPYMWW